MRDILFRAKKADGQWVYGYYVALPDAFGMAYMIHTPRQDPDDRNRTHYIDPDTLGQYTGLTDRNGRKIFEGDIVSGIAYSHTSVGVIVWITDIASFGIEYHSEHTAAWENASILKLVAHRKNSRFVAEVIGNIYDNPELLERRTQHET